MPPAQPGEDALIARLSAMLPVARCTHLGIGDDAAAVELPGGDLLLITTDLLMEDVHFRFAWGDFAQLGWKALAQNLSDIAAMGGAPTHAVIALALPAGVTAEQAAELYRGLGELAEQSGVDVVGGDTIRSSGPLTIGVTVLGRVPAAELLTRGGGRPGDALFVTGALGAAAVGVRLLDSGRPVPEELHPAVLAQLQPQPRLTPARVLATTGRITAMMDLSDGVATDLHRMCRAGGTGAVIERDRLPLAPVVFAACAWLAEGGVHCDPLEMALCGGEDFELLLTAPPDAEDELRRRIDPLPLTRIGALTASPDLLLHGDDGDIPLPWGFTHF